MMNKIKIAFVTNMVPHYRETFYKKLLGNFDSILLSSVQIKENGRPALGYNINNKHHLLNDFELNFLGIDFIYQKGAIGFVKEYDPDIVVILGLTRYLSNWILLFWGKLFRKRVIIWASGWERIENKSIIYYLKRILSFFYYNIADCTLVYSTKGKDYLLPLFLNRKKIKVCYNGIEIDHLLKNENKIKDMASRLRDDYDNLKIFLYVGGMLKEKKVDLLIKAFEKLNSKYNDVILWLVGDGPDYDYFKSLSKQNKKIIFWGRKVNDVDIYFAACDFFVLPGIGGLALNQAMFWGKPCIVSEADGTEDDLIIEDITGCRFEKNNVDSLVSAMEKLYLTNTDIYTAMGKKCRELINEGSNVNIMVNTFVKEFVK